MSASLATVLGPRVTPAGYAWIVGALVVGGSVGLVAAKKVQMTQMPELVALMHSLVGLAVFALVLTAVNMFGGFAVTRRMLAMFRK